MHKTHTHTHKYIYIYKQYFTYRRYSYMFRYICIIIFYGATTPQLARASIFKRFLDNTRRTTVGRTPLDE